jgi:hypothetical protein
MSQKCHFFRRKYFKNHNIGPWILDLTFILVPDLSLFSQFEGCLFNFPMEEKGLSLKLNGSVQLTESRKILLISRNVLGPIRRSRKITNSNSNIFDVSANDTKNITFAFT